MKGAFKYIDDDLQNLKQLLNFRLDDVMPQQKDRSCRSSEYQETNNKDLFHMSSSTNTYGEQPRILDVPDQECISESQSSSDDKPPFHYSDLIEFALRDKIQMTVSDIYDWILQRFPYFMHVDENRWKPAVRHTLTTNPGFYKAKKANRGFLWAYRSPNQRRLMQRQRKTEACLDTPPNKYQDWRKKLCAVQSSMLTHQRMRSAMSTSPQQRIPAKTATRTQQADTALHSVSKVTSLAVPAQLNAGRLIPLIPTLGHCNKTLIADSSDESNDDLTCGECTCKVEYFIPKLPSDIDLSSNSATCIPCCKGSNRIENSSSSCCLKEKSCSQLEAGVISEWSELWDQVHGSGSRNTATVPAEDTNNTIFSIPSSSSTHMLLPSMCRKPKDKNQTAPVSKKSLVMEYAPFVKESKSGHMLYLPIAVPAYKKDAVLKKHVKPAKMQDIPRAVAVAESGLLDESLNLSRLSSIPSSHSVCSSQSATRAIDDMFRLDDTLQCADDNVL